MRRWPAISVRMVRETDMTAGLTALFVPESTEPGSKRVPAQIAGKPHTAITSSRTKWSRIILGRSSGSKWHSTASRTAARRSSRFSACVKIGADRAFASYPPSGDSETEKMISSDTDANSTKRRPGDRQALGFRSPDPPVPTSRSHGTSTINSGDGHGSFVVS